MSWLIAGVAGGGVQAPAAAADDGLRRVDSQAALSSSCSLALACCCFALARASCSLSCATLSALDMPAAGCCSGLPPALLLLLLPCLLPLPCPLPAASAPDLPPLWASGQVSVASGSADAAGARTGFSLSRQPGHFCGQRCRSTTCCRAPKYAAAASAPAQTATASRLSRICSASSCADKDLSEKQVCCAHHC